MSFHESYLQKRRTPHDAVALIEDYTKVHFSGEPVTLLEELREQKGRFRGLFLYTMLGLKSQEAHRSLLTMELEGHISYGVCFFGKGEADAVKNGRTIEYITSHFSQFEDIVERQLKPGYLLANVAPMDDEGYFSLGYAPNGRAAADAGARVILQVNRLMPAVCSDYYKVHIDEVDALCESDTPIAEFPDPEPTETDRIVAGHIAGRIQNGATIQLGYGSLPSAIGLCLMDFKDLGVHTEVFTNTMTMLMKHGAVNNSKKKLYPGLSVTGFCQGTKETYDFLDNNKNVLNKKLSWVNDPEVIAMNNDMVSINSCMSVDLRGQVCSESLGFNTSGGSGGQLDFVRGARKAPGGKSYIAMHSVARMKNGDRISKITLSLSPGSVVTVPRNDVHFIVTEYGVAEMADCSTRAKALNLISIAHPDFRDQLHFEAKKNNII